MASTKKEDAGVPVGEIEIEELALSTSPCVEALSLPAAAAVLPELELAVGASQRNKRTPQSKSSPVPVPDFSDEARKLFASLGLRPSGDADADADADVGTPSSVAPEPGGKQHGTPAPLVVTKYDNINIVWKHKTSGACVFVGNRTAAKTRSILSANDITCVVNCASDLPCSFENDGIAYYRLPIVECLSSPTFKTAYLELFDPFFKWVDGHVSKGENVLIHCYAGAHRAGTAGVAYVMYAAPMHNSQEAIRFVQVCRPCVSPMLSLNALLEQLQVDLEGGGPVSPSRSKSRDMGGSRKPREHVLHQLAPDCCCTVC